MLAHLKNLTPALALQLTLLFDIAQACSHGKNGAISCTGDIFTSGTIGGQLLHATVEGSCSCPSTGLTAPKCKKVNMGGRINISNAHGWVDKDGNYILCSIVALNQPCDC